MKFKAKIRKIGNSFGVIIPKNVITSFTLGEEIELNVITNGDIFDEPAPNVITKQDNVITEKPSFDVGVITQKPVINSSRFELCSKHKGSMKATCGCK